MKRNFEMIFSEHTERCFLLTLVVLLLLPFKGDAQDYAILEGQMEQLQVDVNTVVSEVLGITLFQKMQPFDAWLFGKAYTQEPERASLLVSAQVAMYCWQRSSLDDHSGSEYFIARSLYQLWIYDKKVSLIAGMTKDGPRKARVGYFLQAYTFQYGTTPHELEAWLNKVAAKVPDRHVWAQLAVEKILHRKANAPGDLAYLIKITRNMYHLQDGDLDKFAQWWEKVKDQSRIDWAKDLIELSIYELRNPKKTGRPFAAVRQLDILLPEGVFDLEGLASAATVGENEYAEKIVELRSWWDKNKGKYRVPIESHFAF